ncbi:putative reverse transcriptase domain-containing protein [Tanacetum coccineum]
MANVILPDHVDDLPVVEPNQPDVVPVIPEPVLVDEDEDPEGEELEEEEEPQEEEDMDIDDEEDENEPELTFPYEEVDTLNPPPPASDSEPEDVIEVEDTVKPEDETDSDGLLPGFMRRDIDSLFGRIASLLRRLCGHEMTHALVEKKGKAKDEYYENLVRKLGNAEERAECKKLKKELEEARFSNTLLHMQNEQVERDLYWTRVQAHEIMPPKSAPLTQAAVWRMIKESVDAAIVAERARQTNARNNSSGSGQARGQVTIPIVRECTFAGFMKCNPDNCVEDKKVEFSAATLRGLALTWWNSKVAILGLDVANQMGWTKMKKLMTAEFCPAEELQRMENELWNLKVKEYNMVSYTQRFNELFFICPRMVKPESMKIDAYIRGLSDNIKGEVTSSRPTNLNDVVRMAYKLMEQKLQARNERILEGISKSGRTFKVGIVVVSSGSLPVCERCFTRHIGQCTIKCHKCGMIGHKARYYKEKNVASEKVGEARGRAYAIKDAEPQGPNVVMGTFLLNNHCASILFDSGSDRSFVNTRFSSMLDIDPVKIDTSYEVELAGGRIVSTNIVLKGCTLNLVNHLFEIDLMPIELGTFDVIIGIYWLVKHDAVIVCGEKVVPIPYRNKTLIVEGEKGMSRLKVISCIKAHVPVIRDFPEVFPDELLGLPPPRQVEFRIDLVPRVVLVARAPYRLAPFEMREFSEQLRV